jgi:hypothetical protein
MVLFSQDIPQNPIKSIIKILIVIEMINLILPYNSRAVKSEQALWTRFNSIKNGFSFSFWIEKPARDNLAGLALRS